MTILESLLLGIIEGLTEFLPISSTFHLIVATRIMGIVDTPFVKMFEVAIQAGAIGALLFLYSQVLIKNHKLTHHVVLSFIPTAIIGAVLYPVIKEIFFSTNWLMLTAFVLVAFLFLGIEWMVRTKRVVVDKNLSSLTRRDALKIGIAQALAVIPGVSRSGAVIVTMMRMGYKRDEAAKYTFLLSLPTILSAAALDLYKNRALLKSMTQEGVVLAVGFTAAFVVAYMVMRWLLKYLSTHTLEIFAWYRLVIAALLFAWWL